MLLFTSIDLMCVVFVATQRLPCANIIDLARRRWPCAFVCSARLSYVGGSCTCVCIVVAHLPPCTMYRAVRHVTISPPLSCQTRSLVFSLTVFRYHGAITTQAALRSVASKFREVKFVKIRSQQAVEKWPEANLPTLFMYVPSVMRASFLVLPSL